HRDQHAFLAGDVGAHADLVAQVGAQRHRRDLVDEYGTHVSLLRHACTACPATPRASRTRARPPPSTRRRTRRTCRAWPRAASAATSRPARTGCPGAADTVPCPSRASARTRATLRCRGTPGPGGGP